MFNICILPTDPTEGFFRRAARESLELSAGRELPGDGARAGYGG